MSHRIMSPERHTQYVASRMHDKELTLERRSGRISKAQNGRAFGMGL